MADTRSIVTGASIALALLCASWAVYVSKHQSTGSPARQARSQTGAGSKDAVVLVTTAIANLRQIDVGIQAIGTSNANEAVSITSKTSNIVTAIRFHDGEAVTVGQVLVELDRAQTAADLAAATADFLESKSQFNRSRELLATQALSAAQHEQLESTMKANEARVAAANARLSDTYIRAPFTGRVGLRRVSAGALINPGTIVTTLDDISSIKVDFSVPERNLGELRPGQSVVAHTSTYPGRNFVGKVSSVDSRVDPATRAVIVRAVVPNRDAVLKPGMFLTVDLSKERRAALVVPEEALVPEQARQFVYVIAGSTASKREVLLGRREPGMVEITQGLAAGDHVVIEGTLKLRDGAPVHEIATPATTAVAAAPAS